MNRSQSAPDGPPTGMDAGEIKQRIIRAYRRLASAPVGGSGSQAVIIARFGPLEARLSKVPAGEPSSGMPMYWIEIHSHARGCVIDSCGICEFGERDLARAVDLIMQAAREGRSLQ
ncbi:hypothetical protein [Microvirga yunnanensis]|uniref:hypothetical protein n=1 Tax=Microvirga yunnanensis TaxID=2953740 RepID=UPI0021CA2597|nr:hypothetical protein [Microvirga sp. HBU65207]